MPRRPHLGLVLLLLPFLARCSGGDDDGPDPVETLALVTRTLPAGRVGVPYDAVLQARGGHAPYAFRAGRDQLPEGLDLQEDGLLGGTPLEDGHFAFDVGVSDARGGQARGQLAVDVAPADPTPGPLRFVTDRLPPADVGEPYEVPLAAAGGTPPYAFAIAEGALPDGLALDDRGDSGTVVAGVPTAVGDAEVRLQVSDAGGELALASFTLAVATPPDFLTELLPIAVVGQPYHASLEVAGGAWPFVFEEWSGHLPHGLVLQPSGLVAGVATGPDSRPVRFRVTDAAGVIREHRIRVWAVEDRPWEAWIDAEMPPNCGLAEDVVLRGTVEVTDPAMITRIQVAVDVQYLDMGMVDFDIVAPDGTRVPLHVGGPRAGGSLGIHFMYESDRISWGSFSPLLGLGPRGTWTLEVRVLADPGFGCVEEPGVFQRFAVVLGTETSSEDYLRVRGVRPNNLIDGPFARITGGGLEQGSFDLAIEEWSTGPNGVPEGGTGDDVLIALPEVVWSTDLPAEVGAIDAAGHFQSSEATGQGTLTGEVGERSVVLPVKVVPPDWVP